MIVVVKKRNIILIALVVLLLITIFSLNIGQKDKAVILTKDEGVQKTIILDPGHGGEDPGAVSDYSGLKEKDATLAISLKAKELLEAKGYKVIMTREEDKLEYDPDLKNIVKKRMQDLERRKRIMDESGADLAVSIHLNKFQETQYHGAQAFYPPGSDEGRKLAISIQKTIKEMVDPENRREALEQARPMIILKDYKIPTAIVECGFLSNKEEEKKLATEEYQNKLAEAIVEGIIRYLKQ